MVRLGSIPLDAPYALAPMAALTDSVFRRLIKRQGGCGFVITEMVSSQGLTRGCRKARALLEYTEEERPIGGQIMGADPARMAQAARIVEDLKFDFVDINMGCPARKIVAGGGGAALMRDAKLASSVIKSVQRAVAIPVTVKLRAGWSEDLMNAAELAKLAEDAGAALVTVHARTRSDRFRPGTREDIIAETKRSVAVPVFGNGDVRSPEDARRMMARTGCDGVMAGRGAVANPWLFRELGSGHPSEPSAARARRWILEHFSILMEDPNPRRALGRLKTFSGWYTRGLMRGAALRKRINDLQSPQEFIKVVQEFFADYPEDPGAAGLPAGGPLSEGRQP
jgi:tRNA-dihydrouridine synthase B